MVIIMLGAPGAGKGTVSGKLEKKLNIPQVSTGDIFRKHIAEKTELGILANKYISKGQLVPDDVTIKLIEDKFKSEETKNGIILDGFPRTINQAEELDKILKKLNKEISLVINLDVSEEDLIKRVVNRRGCSKCKAIYNVLYNPPKQENVCDICGGELVQRKDDNEETFKERLHTYMEQTSPLIEYYKKQGKLFNKKVGNSNNNVGEDIVQEVVEYINSK